MFERSLVKPKKNDLQKYFNYSKTSTKVRTSANNFYYSKIFLLYLLYQKRFYLHNLPKRSVFDPRLIDPSIHNFYYSELAARVANLTNNFYY